jgi:UDP-N-acetylmuramate: L-alanyl-gamma-D-glutamyl-meso-diaminopimelate ligase
VFEPRSATSCRRIFQNDFVRAFAESTADEIVLASVFRASLPENDRLSVDEVVDDLVKAGHRARHLNSVSEIVETIAQEARDGDLVVVMSNGGFDAIHEKLLTSLGHGPRAQGPGSEGPKAPGQSSDGPTPRGNLGPGPGAIGRTP